MKSIGIIIPDGRDEVWQCACKAVTWLKDHEISIYTEQELSDRISGTKTLCEGLTPDCYLSIGGDGTLIRAAKYAVQADVPVLGINLGNVGFLTEAEPEQLTKALQAVLDGDYWIDERALICTEVGDESWISMNDVVVSRSGYPRLMAASIYVNGEKADWFRADGVIVSTPTGSTGYSLSAGGPLVMPHVPCMIITPICAHSLQHRPIITGMDAEIMIRLDDNAGMNARLQTDGRKHMELRPGESIKIYQMDKKVRLIRLNHHSFFDVVRHKLTEQD